MKSQFGCIFWPKVTYNIEVFCGVRDQTDPGVIDLTTLKESLISISEAGVCLRNVMSKQRLSF